MAIIDINESKEPPTPPNPKYIRLKKDLLLPVKFYFAAMIVVLLVSAFFCSDNYGTPSCTIPIEGYVFISMLIIFPLLPFVLLYTLLVVLILPSKGSKLEKQDPK